MSKQRVRWAASGDINAFFGLMLDNVADLLLTVSLLSGTFGFPVTFALQHMVPGTAIGVLVGDLIFFWMAIRLARRTGRSNVTAMPLGLDTPSTFGMVFFVLGPAFLAAKSGGMDEQQAARYAWHIGICSIVISGVFKIACAGCASWIRRMVPRAGLLGSLAAIALVLISFMPLLDVLRHPVVGMLSLAVILTTLVARVPAPFRVPEALAAVLVAGIVYYLMQTLGLLESQPAPFNPAEGLWPRGWFSAFRFEWMQALSDSVQYLPFVIPFALGTVVGGIDCTESAAAAGDEYDTRHVIGVEGLATVVAGLCGGVIQTTPYIGHPAYKAMGGRAAYTLATALFVGAAGLFGFFAYLYVIIPKAAIFSILIFVGLEITAQSFQATPRRHYPAIALACVPAMAKLVMIFVGGLIAQSGKTIDEFLPPLPEQLQTMQVLSGGFIITSLLWASALAALIDRRLLRAASYFAIGALCSLFGIIHSPKDDQLMLPWALPELPDAAQGQTPVFMASAYLAVTLMLVLWWAWQRPQPLEEANHVEAHS